MSDGQGHMGLPNTSSNSALSPKDIFMQAALPSRAHIFEDLLLCILLILVCSFCKAACNAELGTPF